MSYGRILSAGIEIDGSQLRIDHVATDTLLDLEDALDYYEPEAGEVIQVRLVAEDDTEELATIKVPETEDEDTVDDEGGFITLAAGLVNDFPAGSRVEVYPETKRLVAQVRLDDAEEDTETVDAVVHHTLYDKIPEGVDLDVAVEMDYDGETFFVTNILGEQPVVDGSFIDPDTVPVPTGVIVADGLTPDDPTEPPVIRRGAPAHNVVDMSAYSRPADFQSFLTEFATSDDLGASFGDWEDLGASGTFQMHIALVYALQYKYRYRVLDIEGLMSGYSPESEPVFPRQVGEDGAIDIAADSITTDMLAALIVLTSMLRVESDEGRVDIGDGAIRAFNNDGAETFRVDGVNNFINGTVVTAILTVLENLIIRTSAELSGGAVMELGTGVSNPGGAPETLWELESAALGTATETRVGLKRNATGGAGGTTDVFVGIEGNGVREWSASTLALHRTYGGVATNEQERGVVYHAPSEMYWFLQQDFFASGNPTTTVVIRPINRSDLTFPGLTIADPYVGGPAGEAMPEASGIATDGTDLFVAAANRTTNKVRVAHYTVNDHPSAGWTPVFVVRTDTTIELADGEIIRDMELHDGKWWFLINAGPSDWQVRVCADDWGTRSTSDDFTTPAQGGLAWDGTQFRVHDRTAGKIWKHTNWVPSNNVHAAYSYYKTGDDDETALSTRATILLANTKKRWGLRVGAPTIPVGADRIRYYLLENATNTVATMKQQAESASSSVVFNSYNASGATTAVSVSEFPTDTPASIQSFSGATVISGDDNHTIPGYFKGSFVRKTADESVASSATLQNDDHLALAVAASSTYLVEAMLIAQSPGTGSADINVGFTGPASAVMEWGIENRLSVDDTVGFPLQRTIAESVATGLVTASKRIYIVKGILRTSATPGTLQLQWAQNTSNPNSTTVYADSYMRLEEVA